MCDINGHHVHIRDAERQQHEASRLNNLLEVWGSGKNHTGHGKAVNTVSIMGRSFFFF